MGRKHSRRPASKATDLEIVVAVAPSSEPSLEHELDLIRPALLYADRVRLISPAALMIASVSSLIDDFDAQLELLASTASVLHDEPEKVMEFIALYRGLNAKRPRTRQELVMLHQIKQMLQSVSSELTEVSRRIVEDAGGADIDLALQAGVLELDVLEGHETSDMIEVYWQRVQQVLADHRAYPLLDDATASLVESSIDEGLFVPAESTLARGRSAGAGVEFIDRLPSFATATIPELLDIRSELQASLTRFRSACYRLSAACEELPLTASLRGELEEVYRRDVAPAIEEINELAAERRDLRELAWPTAQSVGTGAAGLAVGLAATGQVDAALLGGLGAGAVGKAFDELRRRRGLTREMERHDLYFLYHAGQHLPAVVANR